MDELLKNEIIALLKSKNKRVTAAKIDILAHFHQSNKSYSLSELQAKIPDRYNRSTLFRNLQDLSEDGILEKFINTNGVDTFLINNELNKSTQNSHSHFKCTDCNAIENLPLLSDNIITSLGNKKINSFNLIIEGVCDDCSLKNNHE